MNLTHPVFYKPPNLICVLEGAVMRLFRPTGDDVSLKWELAELSTWSLDPLSKKLFSILERSEYMFLSLGSGG